MVAGVRYAAVVLAGGGGRRLGGVAKPVLAVGGRPMLHRVLAAVADAWPRVVVGPDTLPVPAGVARTQEQPPGGGPVPAVAAGLALVPPEIGFLALLAADLPLLTTAAVGRLRLAAAGAGRDGAVFVDHAGRPQWLCGVWRTAALRTALAALAPDLAGTPVHRLLDGRAVTRVTDPGPGPPPWWDCDTGEDLRLAAGMLAASGRSEAKPAIKRPKTENTAASGRSEAKPAIKRPKTENTAASGRSEAKPAVKRPTMEGTADGDPG